MTCLTTLETFLDQRREYARAGKRVVFTNGCFDLLHSGHISLLNEARKAGDVLVVGLNSDASVRLLKGPLRPILDEMERSALLCALKPVDAVVLFDEATPRRLIEVILPDVLVKGADWGENEIVGADIVVKNGGRVLRIDLVQDRSTTGIVERILERYRS